MNAKFGKDCINEIKLIYSTNYILIEQFEPTAIVIGDKNCTVIYCNFMKGTVQYK